MYTCEGRGVLNSAPLEKRSGKVMGTKGRETGLQISTLFGMET